MATRSVLKEVNIKNKKLARTFIRALNDAEHTKYKSGRLSRKCTELTGDKIKDFFDNK